MSVAAHKGREEIVKMLISAGADVNIDSNNGSTPLIQASHFGECLQESEWYKYDSEGIGFWAGDRSTFVLGFSTCAFDSCGIWLIVPPEFLCFFVWVHPFSQNPKLLIPIVEQGTPKW